jgi:sigma54-dependent transcription regulator
MPDPGATPPVVAESGDPFGDLRVVDLVARLERGRPIDLSAVVARLNATYRDWLFEERVVADALVQLQSNWMADYRNTSGIVLDEVDGRATLTIEHSSRVDPWIARQAQRLAAACREALLDFSRRDRPGGEG